MLGGAVVLLALTGGPAMAQGRGHGRGRANAPGQMKKAERAYDARFGDRDREMARNWYYHERRDRLNLPPGFRDADRLPPDYGARLRPGYIIEPAWRARLYPAPVALVRVFAPPPPGYRYMALGGRVLLLDAGFRIGDVIGLELNFAR
jgi:hypothetical protein